MNKRKLIFIFLMIFSILYAQTKKEYEHSTIAQINQLSDADKEKLSQSFVIINDDLIFIGTEEIDGITLSKVVIDSKLIKDAEERYFISHLIRNVLIYGAVIKNFDENGNDFMQHPAVVIEDDYIVKHKKSIIKVLYYLMHCKYFNLYGKLQSSGEKVFTSPVLKPINKDLMELRKKLLKENAIIPVCAPDKKK